MDRTQTLRSCSACVVLFFSLNGPIHDLTDNYLFSAHMVQHLLLTLVCRRYCWWARRRWLLRPILKNRAVRAIARFLTGP